MGFVYDGRCCGCGYGKMNCRCAENNRKFEEYAKEIFTNESVEKYLKEGDYDDE